MPKSTEIRIVTVNMDISRLRVLEQLHCGRLEVIRFLTTQGPPYHFKLGKA